MGFEPRRIAEESFAFAGFEFLGNVSPAPIEQAGRNVNAPAIPFFALAEFRHLHAL
jgi:hypothetical protein